MEICVQRTYDSVHSRGLAFGNVHGSTVEELGIGLARQWAFFAVDAFGLLALSGRWRIVRLLDVRIFHEDQESKLRCVSDYGDCQHSVARGHHRYTVVTGVSH